MKKQRLEQTISAMREVGLSQIIVAEDRAISYLTGFNPNSMERVGALLIKDTGEVHSFMNELFRFPEMNDVISHIYRDGDNPYKLIAEHLNPGKLGFDEKWETVHTISLLKERPDIIPELGSWPVNESRKYKDTEEQALLEKASQINDMAIDYGICHIDENVNEKDLADTIENFFRQSGGINVGQWQVVCYGADAADPHHVPGDALPHEGDAVLIDLVGLINGYWCDMTRTVFYKSVSEENRRIYEIVRRAQQAGIDAVRPGIRMAEIDGIVRKVIEDEGYGEFFITRTGHGVGLSVHEPPMCSPDSDEICRSGMCFSIEPGIYIPGKTGVRIEDLVIVTDNGCRVLTHYPKDLMIV